MWIYQTNIQWCWERGQPWLAGCHNKISRKCSLYFSHVLTFDRFTLKEKRTELESKLPTVKVKVLLVAFFPSRLTHFLSSMKLCAVRELGFSSLMWLISSTVKFISRANSVMDRSLHIHPLVSLQSLRSVLSYSLCKHKVARDEIYICIKQSC